MKKIFLIIFALAFTSAVFADADMDSVAAFTEKTSVSSTDIIPFQTKVSNKYTWRKLTGLSFWGRIRDTTTAYNYGDKDLAQSWTGRQTFNGATFASGSHGAVTFNDSTYFAGAFNIMKYLYPLSKASYNNIGSPALPYDAIYSNVFQVINSYGNDSASISYDDSVLTFSKDVSIPNLSVTNQFTMDSSSSLNSIIYKYDKFAVPNTGDTIMTFTTKEPFVELDLPGSVTPGISKFVMTGAAKGQVVRIYNGEASYTIILKDYIGNDDNLYLSANFTMGTNDIIELMCIDPSPTSQDWIEISRSNN